LVRQAGKRCCETVITQQAANARGARKARNGTVEIVEKGNWVELIGEAHLVRPNLLLQQFEKPFLRETSLINGTLQQTDFQLPLTWDSNNHTVRHFYIDMITLPRSFYSTGAQVSPYRFLSLNASQFFLMFLAAPYTSTWLKTIV
jgi:hypothetical protein